MVRTVQEYNSEKAKVSGVKASITRHCKTLDGLCSTLEELMQRPTEQIPTKTARKKAQEINNIRSLIESKQEELSTKGDSLMEVITEMDPEDTALKNLERMVEQVQDDLAQYTTKYVKLQEKHAITSCNQIMQ